MRAEERSPEAVRQGAVLAVDSQSVDPAKPVETPAAASAAGETEQPPEPAARPLRLGDKAVRKPAAMRSGGGLSRRFLLMVVLPLAVILGGGWFYLQGGRYVATDNAYVGAQKVLITPSVSGRVLTVSVVEGQMVRAGDPLLEIDPASYRIAVADAEARLAEVRTEFATLKANRQGLERQITVSEQTIELRKSALERKMSLAGNRVISAADVDTAQIDLATAKANLEPLKQQHAVVLTQLQGNPALDIADYPPYAAAEAALAKARLDLQSTSIRAPLDGMATQVSAIQLGRWLASGTAVFAVIGTDPIWVDANPKETDLEHVVVGQPATVVVDTFPDVTFRAHVSAISPGTGAQFSILPAQNAAGNWVKVVQRIPIRVEFEPGQDLSKLRSGMSANVTVDTGRKRTLQSMLGPELAGLFGLKSKP